MKKKMLTLLAVSLFGIGLMGASPALSAGYSMLPSALNLLGTDYTAEGIIGYKPISHSISGAPAAGDNILSGHLLNSSPLSHFDGQKAFVEAYHNPELIGNQNGYASNGFFACGYDPNYHNDNGGTEGSGSTIVTPEPGTIFLLGIGLIGAGIRAYRRKK